MERKITIEKNSLGNIIFSYPVKRYGETKVRILIPIFIAICFLLWELITYQSAYFQIIFVPILIYSFYHWMKYTEDENKKMEQKIIYEQLDEQINRDIQSFGETVCELERSYYIDAKDDYGSIGERYLLVLLSNGKELKYSIINPKIYNKILVLEIDSHYKEYNSAQKNG